MCRVEHESAPVKILALQYAIQWEDKAANRCFLKEQLAQKPPPPQSLLVLPELSCQGFSMRLEGLAEDPAEESELFYQELARTHQIYLVAGLSRWAQPSAKGLNLALAINPQGQILGSYAKQHPFSYGGETQYYQAGTDFLTFDWQGCRVAPLICYDLRFPESFRLLALQGVDCFLVLANWPTARVAHWDHLLAARAIENQAYVLGVNRCGQDPTLSYPGHTSLFDPQGHCLSRLDDQPGWLEGALDLSELRAYRSRFPALQDIRREQLGSGYTGS